jgi:hypothetical protein
MRVVDVTNKLGLSFRPSIELYNDATPEKLGYTAAGFWILDSVVVTGCLL